MEHPTTRNLEGLLADAGLSPESVPAQSSSTVIEGLCADSRRVKQGDLFIAIPGLHTDARAYIDEAARRGASAVLTEGNDPFESVTVPVVRVPDARVAAACLYDAWYGHPARRLRLVGVTGTNGKTTVSSMLRHILRAAGIPCGLIGTVGCVPPTGDGAICIDPNAAGGMTTPDPWTLYPLLAHMAEGADPDDPPVVVMEVTSHALALGKVAPLRFEMGIFTNLSPEHLDLHGTMEDYYAAKRRLFEISRLAVINADDRFGRMLLGEPLPTRHWYICHATGLDGLPPDRMCPAGEGSCTRAYAEQVKLLAEDGVAFKLTTPDIRLRLRCPIPGEFSVMNALEASVAALSLGATAADVRDALRIFSGVPGRMERVRWTAEGVKCPDDMAVYIDFAHTPDALEKLLGVAHGMRRRGRRIVLLFGCGGDRDRSKRKIMGRIASRMADFVIVTSDNSRTEAPEAIISDILQGVDKESAFAVIPDRAEAIEYAVRGAREGDIILLAGKGHETYEITADGIRPFCEKQIVCEAVKRYYSV